MHWQCQQEDGNLNGVVLIELVNALDMAAMPVYKAGQSPQEKRETTLKQEEEI